jgi:hypothetical protein
MFLQYYETWANEVQGLDMVWQFGRVVRNACAHDGKIRIQNPKAASVNWRTLSYSSADNGHLIFDDFTAVEMISLMEDMDSALRGTQ